MSGRSRQGNGHAARPPCSCPLLDSLSLLPLSTCLLKFDLRCPLHLLPLPCLHGTLTTWAAKNCKPNLPATGQGIAAAGWCRHVPAAMATFALQLYKL